MKLALRVETALSQSARVKQLGAMFDVPLKAKSSLEWTGDFPFDEEPWNVGLIVGPSGCGKTQIMRHVFGESAGFAWDGGAVIDDFDKSISMVEISEACNAVGFNTIPSWMRPYHVLSNGEKFRVELARALVERSNTETPIVVDEFTSVVDRQVAQIGSHAVQKFIRKRNQKFVAVSCHYDIVEWLQPDWILEPATMTFSRRLLQRRPALEIEIRRVPYDAWRVFSPYHYMTAELNNAARCFAVFVRGQIAAFAGCLHMPHPKRNDIVAVSRLVTLPDWQGLGLAMILCDAIGEACKSIKRELRTYPAHPSLIRSFDRSPRWALERKPGNFSAKPGTSSQMKTAQHDRACAVFSYRGPSSESVTSARALLAGAWS